MTDKSALDLELSDEEARKLLAEMDSPVSEDVTSVSAEGSQAMGDVEARKLLEAMDAPVGKSESSDSMNDEEARKLLAAMDEPPAVESAPSPAAPVKTVAKVEVPPKTVVEQVSEIEEWEPNDFQKDPSMVEDFVTNGDELLATLDATILRLEESPRDKETIEEIFRAAHTLKGGAGMFGFKALERVMHRMESLFDKFRKGSLVATAELIDLILKGMDVVRSLHGGVKNGAPCGVKTAPIVNALTAAVEGFTPVLEKGSVTAAPQELGDKQSEQSKGSESSSTPSAGDDVASKPVKKKNEAASTIRVDLQRLDALVNLVGELVIDRTRFMNIEEDLRATHPQLKATGNLAETLQQYSRHMNDIQNIIMKVRMVPIGNAFNKYPRIVRDLARTLGKKINLVITGDHAEMDKTLVEQLADPLVHLIRNACDHGVEDPETRVSSGKSAEGTIFLSAAQEGNQIVIAIKDDGKGMDPVVIRNKGIEKGLISADETLTDEQIFNLIFEAGFSTSAKVTTVSGRGVGMDVVRKQIAKLKGVVVIKSKKGEGSTIEIRLPLTLAIVQSLLIRSGNETFAVPLDNVVESIRVETSTVEQVGAARVIRLRDSVLPLMDLSKTLRVESKSLFPVYQSVVHLSDSLRSKHKSRPAKKKERIDIVVLDTGGKRFGIVVDSLLNQQEMVIKPMGSLLKDVPCISGGAVLGDGNVVLVLDIAELSDAFGSELRVAS